MSWKLFKFNSSLKSLQILELKINWDLLCCWSSGTWKVDSLEFPTLPSNVFLSKAIMQLKSAMKKEKYSNEWGNFHERNFVYSTSLMTWREEEEESSRRFFNVFSFIYHNLIVGISSSACVWTEDILNVIYFTTHCRMSMVKREKKEFSLTSSPW